MSLSRKVAFSLGFGVVLIAALSWMRQLASWRPQKMGRVPSRYTPQYISGDGLLVPTMDVGAMGSPTSYNYRSFDLRTGKSTAWPIFKAVNTLSRPAFGWDEPFIWRLAPDKFGAASTLELQNLSTHRTEHTFPWRNLGCSETMEVKTDARTAQVLTPYFFRVFDLATNTMTHEVRLEKPFPSHANNENIPRFAIAPDGKLLYACLGLHGKMWRSTDGKLLNQWTLTAPPNTTPDPNFFSPDGRTVIFRSNMHWIFADSANGKIRWQQTINVSLGNCFFPQENTFLVPQKSNCEVRDVATGRRLRSLPGPSLSDPNIIRVTSDWIYTTTLKGEIFRWRTR